MQGLFGGYRPQVKVVFAHQKNDAKSKAG